MSDLDPQTLIDIQLSEQLLALQKKRLLWAESKPLLAPVIKALIQQGIEPNINDNYVNVSFAGDAAKLKAAIDVLCAAGFKTVSEPPKPGDTSWYAFFKRPESQLDIWFNFTSSVCVRRKIGTTMVEQDVFETICGDCTAESMQLPAPPPVLRELDECPF